MIGSFKELTEKQREHRPCIHFTCRKGWINDPNGLIFHNGYYHLFYQHYPDGPTHGEMHWGHAISSDLLQWKELPIALSPDENGTIFSGCMVYDRTNTSGLGQEGIAPLVAIFTHHLEKEGRVIQSQSLAYSLDNGENFLKYEGNPVLNLQLADFRDPKVFYYEKNQEWIMLVAAGRKILFFTSPSLKNWTYASTFTVCELREDEIWECPDLQLLKTETGEQKWVLFLSQNTRDYKETGVRYFTGDFNGRSFENESGEETELMADFGYDNYAAATFADTEDRIIQLSWMNCWEYAHKLPEAGFRGSLTIPRELSLRGTISGYRLIQTPIRELHKACPTRHINAGDTPIELHTLPCLYEIHFDKEQNYAALVNKKDRILLQADFENKSITVDRSACAHEAYGPQFRQLRKKEYLTDYARSIKLLLDITSIELFAADGEAVCTLQYFTDEPFTTLEIW